ncbi:hypothetical protein SRB5_22030 [Streptomyces sp. RB5]|uniref:Sugar ABC transporter substrate-binding protein n=1 Tax=Streptomyces smaragdinus TaxID=2585196 RepID=A0A7K0CH49_9ACTN|nr:extracellular solute-binding protein [Streptomyces smaragdinus]MQY12074.1 hypothetical protein [Streptomyces smaragdinus]
MRPLPRSIPLILAAALATTALTACGSDSGSDKDTVKVQYKRSTDAKNKIFDRELEAVKKEFEEKFPDKKVELVPLKVPDEQYYTKVQQMIRTKKTSPDLVYEDTFLINSDITAGLLTPLDGYLKKWPDWDQYIDTAKTAARGQDGKTYGVPDGTDTRGLWYSKELFEKAGLPADWQPKNWDDVLSAARTVKQELPDVIPLNIYTGKAVGEAASMQGFEMLLYGTEDTLYDESAKKWVAGSQGFKDALGFVETVFKEKLGPDPQDALDPNAGTKVATEWFPQGKLAIDLDGSWMGNNWQETGAKPWPEWTEALGQTAMPTQNGQAPGRVSMSGGWTWAIPSNAGNPDLAFEFMKIAQSQKNCTRLTMANGQIAVRKDVAADPEYQDYVPGIKFFTDLVADTHYRPALPVYPQVSTAIQEAMEQVTTGDAAVDDAAKSYDEQLESIAEGQVVRQ